MADNRKNGVNLAPGYNAQDSGKGSRHDKLHMSAPAPKTVTNGSVAKVTGTRYPGMSSKGNVHKAH